MRNKRTVQERRFQVRTGRRLAEIRGLCNVKQEVLARKLKLTQQGYSHMERGEATIRLSHIVGIANVLRMYSGSALVTLGNSY